MKKLVAILMAVVMVISMAGCGKSSSGATDASQGTQDKNKASTEEYAVIMSLNQLEFFDALKAGVSDAAKDIGAKWYYAGPQDLAPDIWICPDYIKSLSSPNSDLLSAFDSTSINKINLLRPTAQLSDIIYNIVDNLGVAYNSTEYGSDLLKTTYLQELLVYLNRAFQLPLRKEAQISISYDDKINNILYYINENLNGDVSLDTLSAKFYISKYHLLREFKKNTGYTIHRYTQQKRLILAKELLKGNSNITEVCTQCGFGDYSNFIRSFRKEFGISPKKYSKKL